MSLATSEFSSGQWRDINQQRRYPFVDSASLLTDTGYQLSDYLLVDARVYIPGLQGVLSLLRLSVDYTKIVLTVGKYNSTITASATLYWNSPTDDLTLFDTFGNCCGVLVGGDTRWAELSQIPQGVHEFASGQSAFVPAVCVGLPNDAERIRGPQGQTLGDNIRLVGENGVRLEPVIDELGMTVLVHAVGNPLYRQTDCELETTIANQVIERVVFQSGETTVECTPNGEGRIFILPATYSMIDSALRINNIHDGLQFELVGKSLEIK